MNRLVLTLAAGLALAAAMAVVGPAAGPAMAADGGDKAAPVDVAAMTCGDLAALAASDAATYDAVGVWLGGWLSGKAGETAYAPDGGAVRLERWRQACAGAPEQALLAVASPDGADAAADGGFDMAFLKCYQFIELADEDRPAAVAVIRWNDGWHAGAIGETHFVVKDHEKMADGFVDACAGRKYRSKNLIRVMGGKYR